MVNLLQELVKRTNTPLLPNTGSLLSFMLPHPAEDEKQNKRYETKKIKTKNHQPPPYLVPGTSIISKTWILDPFFGYPKIWRTNNNLCCDWSTAETSFSGSVRRVASSIEMSRLALRRISLPAPNTTKPHARHDAVAAALARGLCDIACDSGETPSC